MKVVGKLARRRQYWQIVWGVVLLVVALTVAASVGYYLYSRPKGLDPISLCPADGPGGHTVLLVDKTDPLNFTQRQAFMVSMRLLVDKEVPTGYLLSVFTLGEDFTETAAPIMELCNPGTGSDKSDLTANLKRLREQYEGKFLNPLMTTANELSAATVPGARSPIFEMLQLVAINGFKKRDVRGPRRLLIVSDMLHNTPQFSMYKSQVDYKQFLKLDYSAKVFLDLQDVEVELLYLVNVPHLQTTRNARFWGDHFDRARVRRVTVRPLEG
jgi:hypothetical protein